MYTYTFGGKNGRKHILHESHDMVVVRTRNARDLNDAVVSEEGKKALKNFSVELEFPEADITVFKTKPTVKNRLAVRNSARKALKKESELRFAGRVLVEADGKTIVLYTENIFIKFLDQINTDTCEKILTENNLTIKQKPDYARNTYFVSAPEDTGLRIFEIAESLLNRNEVELCHPELIRKRGFKKIHSKQWHLKSTTIEGVRINAGVKADLAHKLSLGENITIAIIDDGFDIDHCEFNLPGKVVHSRDVTLNINDPRPKHPGDNHGTACAGVATAAGNRASGVAPGAMLMPVRLVSNLGSIAEANAFKWATDHGADVISCSWGPPDGYWEDPRDPVHTTQADLPDSTRLAMDYAVSYGRNGKGCVITFAAGNGNEDISFDGYASYHKVVAVAACNDTNKRSVYSDYGSNVWCAFPSNDRGSTILHHPKPLTTGIYTTDRRNIEGYNPGGDYTGDFGGTSSACPGVAGTVALMLSANPDLTLQQVKDIIRETSEKIDKEKGEYDEQGHSKFYGYGKVNAEKAVKRAMDLIADIPLKSKVKIISALVNPNATDKGNEKISILNTSNRDIDLKGWFVEVKGRKEFLSGVLSGGEARTFTLASLSVRLANTGATINLLNPRSEIIDKVTYQKKQVKTGVVIEF
jgi:subtilisin family serine protease